MNQRANQQRTFTPLPSAIRAELFLHLATMERAGLPVDKAFSNLRLPAPAQERVVNTMMQLQKGKDIPTAGAASGLFDALETQLLRAAIQAGSPAITYKRLADRYALKTKLQKNMRSRLMLPSFMLILSFVLSVLPALVTGSIGIAAALWQCILPILVIAGIYYAAKIIHTSMADFTYALILQLPYFGALHRRINLKDYFESLALMLEAGIPMFDALPKANKSIHNHLIRAQFQRVASQVKQGKPFSEALETVIKHGHFEEASAIEIIKTGEATGALPEMLWRHVNNETQAIADSLEQLAAWVPRVIYGLVAMWVAYGILTSGAFMPKV
jgi:general secretion pathway protein F